MNNNRRDRDENGNPRFRLSLEEQIIISERRRRREAIEAERERREMASVKPIVMDKKNKVRFGFIAAAALVAVFGIIAIIMQFILFGADISDEGNFKVMYGEEQISTQIDGSVYLDMSKVAGICGLSRAGDKLSPKYLALGGDDIQFTYGSKVARVNGQSVLLRIPAKEKDGALYIPVSAVEDLFRGASLSGKAGSDLSFELTGEGISFVAKSNDTVSPELYGEYGGYDTSKTSQYLLLVNKTHMLQMDDAPTDLKNIPSKYTHKNIQLRSLALEKLRNMMDAMYAAGHSSTFVTSAYRDYQYQNSLFNTYVQQEMAAGLTLAEAQKKVATYSALPGTSEHQSGLCVDLMVSGMAELDESFEDYEVFQWLSENAYKYGFVLRFPEGKTDITGYTYEPWHYRYVGEYHAAVMHALDLTLEEYVDYIK